MTVDLETQYRAAVTKRHSLRREIEELRKKGQQIEEDLHRQEAVCCDIRDKLDADLLAKTGNMK